MSFASSQDQRPVNVRQNSNFGGLRPLDQKYLADDIDHFKEVPQSDYVPLDNILKCKF